MARTWKHHKWTPEQDALLGTMYDSDIMKLLGIARSVVRHRRRRLGITGLPRGRPVKNKTMA